MKKILIGLLFFGLSFAGYTGNFIKVTTANIGHLNVGAVTISVMNIPSANVPHLNSDSTTINNLKVINTIQGNLATFGNGVTVNELSVTDKIVADKLQTTNGATVNELSVTDLVAANKVNVTNGITANELRVVDGVSVGGTYSGNMANLSNGLTANALSVGTGGFVVSTNAIVVNNGGNVGIGTAAPRTALDVVGTVSASALQVNGAITNYGVLSYLPVSGDANVQVGTLSTPGINVGGSVALGGRYNSSNNNMGTYAAISGLKENASNNDSSGYMGFYTGRDSVANATEKMRIDSLGNVGIGTTAPGTSLEVVGTVSASALVVGNQGAVAALTSNYYTPTATPVTNITGCTGNVSYWQRVGNIVTVYGKVNAHTTSALTEATVRISLPVASAISAQSDAWGVANCWRSTDIPEFIIGEAANDSVELYFVVGAVVSQTFVNFTFSYIVK